MIQPDNEELMRLFRSDLYVPTDVDPVRYLSTPLGQLGREYAIKSRARSWLPFAKRQPLRQEQHHYRHSHAECAIYRWAAPGCILEELIVKFRPPRLELSPDFVCQALVVRIEAAESIQSFKAKLFWLPGYCWQEGSGASGEGLESRTWTNANWKVTVGTENMEYLSARSQVENWMPQRFAEHYADVSEGWYVDFVEMGEGWISIDLPKLEAGDRCQLQFVIASDVCNDNNDTWLAVDQNPEDLLKAGDCE